MSETKSHKDEKPHSFDKDLKKADNVDRLTEHGDLWSLKKISRRSSAPSLMKPNQQNNNEIDLPEGITGPRRLNRGPTLSIGGSIDLDSEDNKR